MLLIVGEYCLETSQVTLFSPKVYEIPAFVKYNLDKNCRYKS